MLIYSMSVSVDGFIADREGAFGWTALAIVIDLDTDSVGGRDANLEGARKTFARCGEHGDWAARGRLGADP